jgi:addiction module HigA family antidote
MNKKQDINAGGINGLGEGLINTNSGDFLELKAMIKKAANTQSEREKIENGFLSIRFQMESYLNDDTNELILPGTFIEKFLEVINIKKKVFAAYVNYEVSNLSALLKGRRKINSDLAIKLGKIFKTNPAIWLHLESKNDLIKEIQGREEEYKQFNLTDLLKKAS